LDWIGLEWILLYWIGLEWIYCIGLDRNGLKWIVLYWIGNNIKLNLRDNFLRNVDSCFLVPAKPIIIIIYHKVRRNL
jgi:hypothetical protein